MPMPDGLFPRRMLRHHGHRKNPPQPAAYSPWGSLPVTRIRAEAIQAAIRPSGEALLRKSSVVYPKEGPIIISSSRVVLVLSRVHVAPRSCNFSGTGRLGGRAVRVVGFSVTVLTALGTGGDYITAPRRNRGKKESKVDRGTTLPLTYHPTLTGSGEHLACQDEPDGGEIPVSHGRGGVMTGHPPLYTTRARVGIREIRARGLSQRLAPSLLFVAPHLWIGLPPDPPSRRRPRPSPYLRLHEHLVRGLTPRKSCAMPGAHVMCQPPGSRGRVDAMVRCSSRLRLIRPASVWRNPHLL